ncbi:MAG TPA: PDGLE domain-containing protein [Actinomycetota bacterium]
MRSSNLRLFVAGGLLVAIGLAMLVSGFAASSPDGLNKVAEDHGFAANARQHLFENGPLAGYAVKGVNGDRLSTGISGLIGVLVTFGIGLALFALLRAMRSGGDGRSEPTRAP